MPRSNEEWIAKHDDQAIPERVKLRIFERDGRTCQICGGDIRPGDGVDFHHVPPLADGGEHRESKIYSVHRSCHRTVTASEATQRSQHRQSVKKHYGLASPKPGGFQTNRNGKWKKRMDGSVVPRSG